MIWLNHAYTSIPKAPEVVEAMRDHVQRLGDADAGIDLQVAAGDIIAKARHAVASMVGGASAGVILTPSSTFGTNLVLKSILSDGGHVVTTDFDHHAVGRPLERLRVEHGLALTRVAPDERGHIEAAAIRAAIRGDTRLLVITHASNVSGAVCDLAAVGRVAKEEGVPLFVDAAATVGLVSIDVDACNIAALSFGVHKRLRGPGGIAALWVAPEVALRPLVDGSVLGLDEMHEPPGQLPWGVECGTANLLGMAALAAAARRAKPDVGALTRLYLERLADLPGAELMGPRDAERQIPIFSLRLDGAQPSLVATRLRDTYGIHVAAGLSNAPYLHEWMGTTPGGTLRVSPGETTTDEESERAFGALEDVLGAS